MRPPYSHRTWSVQAGWAFNRGEVEVLPWEFRGHNTVSCLIALKNGWSAHWIAPLMFWEPEILMNVLVERICFITVISRCCADVMCQGYPILVDMPPDVQWQTVSQNIEKKGKHDQKPLPGELHMKKTKTMFTIVLTLLTLAISSQPAMSHNSENVIPPGVVLGAVARTLIASQAGYYPDQQYPSFPRQAFYRRPVLVVVPSPAFGSRSIIYVPQPGWYEEQHRQHSPHRRRWNRHGERVRW